MTLFEYLAIAFSLVLSFAAMRILAGLPHVIAPDRRYWVHIVFVLCTLMVTAVGFWNMWNFRVVEWTLARFLLLLGVPASLYFVACVLVPERAAEVESWRDHYFETRRRYFVGLIIAVSTITLSLFFLLGLPLLDPRRFPQYAGGLIGIVGFLTPDERVHRALATLLAASLAFAMLAIFGQPGFLEPRATP